MLKTTKYFPAFYSDPEYWGNLEITPRFDLSNTVDKFFFFGITWFRLLADVLLVFYYVPLQSQLVKLISSTICRIYRLIVLVVVVGVPDIGWFYRSPNKLTWMKNNVSCWAKSRASLEENPWPSRKWCS